MLVPGILKRRSFWLGFAVGSGATVALLALSAVVWVLQTKGEVEHRLDRQWEEYTSRTRPLLQPPPLPQGSDPPPAQVSHDLAREGAQSLPVDFSNWQLETLTGREIRGEDLSGEILFLNFWATWCKPCVAELPSIQKLTESSEAEHLDVRFLLITDEDRAEVEGFLKARGDLAGLPIALNHDGVPGALWFEERPVTFVVGCDRAIRLRHIGPAEWNSPDFRSYLEEVGRDSCEA